MASNPQFHKPTYTAGSLDHTFAFPSPRRVPTFPSPRVPSELVHPSSRILLSSPSPRVRHLMTSRRHLLTALETATLPRTDLNSPPKFWWQDEYMNSSLPPLTTRTLARLRTSNTRFAPTPPSASDSSLAPTGGQGTHFARLTPFRFTTHTRTHGPTTDFSHPSYCASVAAGRTLWQRMYRDEHYKVLNADYKRMTMLRQSLNRSPLQGHWLRKGVAPGRDVEAERKLVREGEEGDFESYLHGVEGKKVGHGAKKVNHRRDWSMNSISSTSSVRTLKDSIKRTGTKLKRTWTSIV
jgi:hypothetical protein